MKRYYLNTKTIKRNLYFITFLLFMFLSFKGLQHVAQYPELYFTTWRYQLKNEIVAGDVDAITYYDQNYKQKGIALFDDI